MKHRARRRARTIRALCLGVLAAACLSAQSPQSSTAASTTASTPPADSDDLASAQELLAAARRQAHALEFDRAFATFQEAVQVSRHRGDARGEAEALLSLGLTHRQAGAPQMAVRYLEQALDVLSRVNAVDDRAQVLCELARTQNAVGQRQAARRNLDAAAELFRRLGDDAGLGRVDSLRSLVAVHSGHYDDAQRFGRRARKNPRTPAGERLRAASAEAYALHQQQRWQEASEAYDAVLELAWQRNDQSQLGFAYCNRAEVRWQLGEAKPALDDLWRAVRGFEQGRLLIPSTGDQRSAFIGRQMAAYDRLIRYLVDTSQSHAAFEVAERFHARSFLEMLDHRANERLTSRHPTLVSHRQRLLDELGNVRLRLENAPPETPQLQQDLIDLETELLAVEAQLLWHDRDPRQLPSTPTPTWQQVEEGLAAGEALVAYWVSDQRIMVWTVLDGVTRLTQLAISRDTLRQQVSAYLGPLRSPQLATDLALADDELIHLRQGMQLYDGLVARLPAEVRRARRWIVVADDVLHYLPFESLVMDCPDATPVSRRVVHGAYAGCRFLGLEQPLAYSPSAGAFLALRERLRRRRAARLERPGGAGHPALGLLAIAPSFGDPSLGDASSSAPATSPSSAVRSSPAAGVPATDDALVLRQGLLSRAPLRFARHEAERIAALFPGAKSWFAEQAGEGRLKDEASHFRWLHLATHGLVDDALPMSSGILLAADDGEDGLLQAHEVLGLDLRADLVTLSACRTGRGRLQRGEGVVGLSRAFLTAGAGAVLVSQWDIDDRSTPLLMEAFYRHLAVGVPAPEALVKARRFLFEQQGTTHLVFKERPLAYAHPRFWASFVLSGGF